MPSAFQLTEDATRDLERTMHYLSERSPSAAHSLADRFEEAFRLLADFPNLGYRTSEFAQAPVRFWNEGGYLITYLPDSKPLLILAVTHGSRDASAEIEFRIRKQ